MKTTTLAALPLAIAAGAAACSSSGGQSPVSCGAGTTLVGSQCVANADASADSMGGPDVGGAETSGIDGSPDGAPGDGALEDAPHDGTSDSPGICSPAGLGDAGTSADPCMALSADFVCDQSCSINWTDASMSDETMCRAAACNGGGSAIAGSTRGSVDRTPNAPGIDPRCAADCPTDPWAYGLSVTFLGGGGLPPYTVKVSPPWYLLTGTSTPFCPTSSSPPVTNCLAFDATQNEQVYVVTCDPSAPARNITVEPGTQCP
jgi:hypothetical protein